MATYTTAGPSYLPSYYRPYMDEDPGYCPPPVAPRFAQWSRPIPRRAKPIVSPRPERTAVWGVAVCQQLEEQAAQELERKEAARERARKEAERVARQPELPSLRALRDALPETSARRPTYRPKQAAPSEHKVPSTPPRPVFRAPPALFHIEDERRNRAPHPTAAVPAPEVGWTVRLVPSKPVDTSEDDLPYVPIPPRFREAPSSRTEDWRELPIPPYAGAPAPEPKWAAPRGPRPCIAHRRAFSDNTAAFEPLRPVHERRHTFSDVPPPVPPKDEAVEIEDEENVPPQAPGRFLEVPKQVHPPTPPPKDLEDTVFICVFCLENNVGTRAHQEHIRRHGRV
ncbi:hypothetical protein PsYK624_084970 [Phanerochaete sordida]|uniref:Uncharacterized protein n=1 Tax=Phanerochaete sordida TaxID=48140 RepID=A0A9P3GAB8_9APHY|nr:hypothetical protein PsYK624_084970 [Phanerochaete sordida]